MDFATALQRFKQAALDLGEAWGHSDGDIFGATYPGYLPSFDEFVLDVQSMEPAEREKAKRTIVVTYTGPAGVGADDMIERTLNDLSFVDDVEVHYEDMLERGEH
jgi:hypothetical protein